MHIGFAWHDAWMEDALYTRQPACDPCFVFWQLVLVFNEHKEQATSKLLRYAGATFHRHTLGYNARVVLLTILCYIYFIPILVHEAHCDMTV